MVGLLGSRVLGEPGLAKEAPVVEEQSGVFPVEETQTFSCPGCERDMPWSEGAYDDLPELCNDCACEVWIWRDEAARQEEASRGASA